MVRNDPLQSLVGPDYLGDATCSKSMDPATYRTRLSEMFDKLINNETDNIVPNEEDMKKGLRMYFATVFCSNTPKQLYKFFSNLVSTQTPKTLLLALVNTIISGNVREFSEKEQLNKFYNTIDEIFKLEYGNILLASSSKDDLKKIFDNEWPFFENHTEMVKECFLGGSCQYVQDLVRTSATTGEHKNTKCELIFT